jgi:hypothetical protein
MIPQARHHRAHEPPPTVLNSLPPEFRPYLRRVAMLMVLAAAIGVALALLIPTGHHS